ncbi:ABC transporter permease [Chromobacterium alticapitis]|uniref:ABC transmembrane type-1 domain-containing protein n=1 Tax=Chromobacterium alticapitis TaxID=2073169 RepID=A0A2S5DD17_9NEIS|nr:ABC transporter permease [Chromobacterium alticapitis]POZ60990.1 hypothetical protein C2I19_16060 [Chromobacterium alticapitis]
MSTRAGHASLALCGILPVAHATLNGLDAVPDRLCEIARGMGMTPGEALRKMELPLAAPVILAGIRTSVVMHIGTAAIASAVGAKTLGLPILIGLSGFNTAYVIQGALLVALLAVSACRAGRKSARRSGRDDRAWPCVRLIASSLPAANCIMLRHGRAGSWFRQDAPMALFVEKALRAPSVS